MINWWQTSFDETEIEGVVSAIRSRHISQGPITPKFEQAFCEAIGARHAVATTSGSMALLVALLAARIGPGCEVIVPNRTFVATAHAVMLAGATVVLADTRRDVPTLDLGGLDALITPRTKAIIPVHMNGRAPDIVAIVAWAKRNKLVVIEDAAQAFGSRREGKFLGTFGEFGCFSLGMSKAISTGQGGVIVTDDAALAERMRLLRSHGVVDVFDADYQQFGFNFRFTDLAASIGLAQLAKVPQKIEHCTAVYKRYSEGLRGLRTLEMLPVDLAAGEFPVWSEALAKDRTALLTYLEKQQIIPRKLLPNLSRSRYLNAKGEFPNSERFDREGLILPGGPNQPIENVDAVIAAIREFDRSVS